ncbi:MAG: DUF177 domain-containing protein [Bdellovibrionaceae bacterium]|nr:DUF177 domain-containing protein [Bdellovibrio sp.]
MKIRLNEIPESGREYILNRNTAELNGVLQDLVQNTPYDVTVFIKPLNTKDFEMSGHIKSSTGEQCSRCGDDFNYNVQKKIREILIPHQDEDRTSKYARSSTPISETANDTNISVSSYRSSQFDLGEFIHEAIAIEVPFNPMPPCKANGDCSLCSKPLVTKPFVYDEKMGDEAKLNPFIALKDLKIT